MNKKSLLFVPVLSLCLASCGSSQKGQEMEDLTQFVDPRIGTGGHGHVFYGANVPYGFIQLGLQAFLSHGTGYRVIMYQTLR